MTGPRRETIIKTSLKLALVGVAALAATAIPNVAFAQQISTIKDGIHVIMGRGGNIGVSVGDDGVSMIDDQFAPATQAILEQIKTVTDQPVRFLVNIHFHRDHTGGNENLGKAGVLIFAHDNVRARPVSLRGGRCRGRPRSGRGARLRRWRRGSRARP